MTVYDKSLKISIVSISTLNTLHDKGVRELRSSRKILTSWAATELGGNGFKISCCFLGVMLPCAASLPAPGKPASQVALGDKCASGNCIYGEILSGVVLGRGGRGRLLGSESYVK